MTHKLFDDSVRKRFDQTMDFIDFVLRKIHDQLKDDPELSNLTIEQLKAGIKDITIKETKLVIQFDSDKIEGMVGNPIHVTEFTIDRKFDNTRGLDDQ